MFASSDARSRSSWYFEALCQGLAIGFSEVLLVIWYSKNTTSAVVLGLALTLPAAIGAVTQAFSTRFHRKGWVSHKLAYAAIATQVCGLFLMATSLALTTMESAGLWIGQILYWMGGMTATSPTQEILAKTIPVEEHNRFFSRRAILVTVVTLACNFVSSWFLDQNLARSTIAAFILFAGVARLASLYVISRQSREIPEQPTTEKIIRIEPKASSDAVVSILKLSGCIFLFRCAVNISSPFYSAYMLSDLSFSLMTYSLFTAVPLVTKSLCLTNWARLLDDNRKFEGLLLAIMMIGVVPLFWASSQSMPILFSTQIASGLSWAGFDLIAVLMVQQMYPRSITKNLGLFLALGSLGSVAGGLIGGVIHTMLESNYQTLFAVSGILRLFTGFFLLWFLRRHRLFQFHQLKLRSGISTIMAIRPSIHAAARIVPLSTLRRKYRHRVRKDAA